MSARFVAPVVILLLSLLQAPSALAATPTPTPAAPNATPSPESSATPLPIPAASIEFGDEGITWEPVPGAAEYRIAGTVGVLRANAADPACTPPLETDARTIAIDETVAGSQTALSYGLPSVGPIDRWVLHRSEIRFTAHDGSGTVIAETLRGSNRETLCDAALDLPAAGLGGEHDVISNRVPVMGAITGLVGLLLLTLTARRHRA